VFQFDAFHEHRNPHCGIAESEGREERTGRPAWVRGPNVKGQGKAAIQYGRGIEVNLPQGQPSRASLGAVEHRFGGPIDVSGCPSAQQAESGHFLIQMAETVSSWED
jgi:hypothetical protein